MQPVPDVLVVGAGISGAACARVLHDAGLTVRLVDRGGDPGGRLCTRRIDGRPVDLGAAYFTVDDEAFAGQVADWTARGLARPWTDTFALAGPDGLRGTKTGPVRHLGTAGLRPLVADLLTGLDVRSGTEVTRVSPGPSVDGEAYRAVVVAMPEPQARRVLAGELAEEVAAVRQATSEPALTLHARFPARAWPDFDAAFVADHPVLALLVDDGARVGDRAPVLVAQSTAGFARGYLTRPDDATGEFVAAVRSVLEIPAEPLGAGVTRWGMARPADQQDAAFHLGDELVGLCGDSWGPASKVQTAYSSGRTLGEALVRRLT